MAVVELNRPVICYNRVKWKLSTVLNDGLTTIHVKSDVRGVSIFLS